MIITTIVIIGTVVGLGTGLLGGVIGYAIGNRQRLDQHDILISYYSQPQPEYIEHETSIQSVFSTL